MILLTLGLLLVRLLLEVIEAALLLLPLLHILLLFHALLLTFSALLIRATQVQIRDFNRHPTLVLLASTHPTALPTATTTQYYTMLAQNRSTVEGHDVSLGV